MTKTRWHVFLGSQFQLPFAYKMWILSFTKKCAEITWVNWKTFTFLYDKFAQDNRHQILSESAGLCRRYDNKTFWSVFFGSQWRTGFNGITRHSWEMNDNNSVKMQNRTQNKTWMSESPWVLAADRSWSPVVGFWSRRWRWPFHPRCQRLLTDNSSKQTHQKFCLTGYLSTLPSD